MYAILFAIAALFLPVFAHGQQACVAERFCAGSILLERSVSCSESVVVDCAGACSGGACVGTAAKVDQDSDGLWDNDEARLGADSSKRDTDGDGYMDGQEVYHGYDPAGPGSLTATVSSAQLATQASQVTESTSWFALLQQEIYAWPIVNALLSGFFLVLLIPAFLVYVVFSFSVQRIAQKLGIERTWRAWVPVWQWVVMFHAADTSGWWTLLFFVPIVNIGVWVFAWWKIALRTGHPGWLSLLQLIPGGSVVLPLYIALAQPPVQPPMAEPVVNTQW